MGAFIVGLLIGLAVAAVVYWRLKTKLDRKRQEVQQLRQNLEEQERAYELRLKQTVQSLQADYQQQLAQKTEQQTGAIQQQYEARIQELETARELAIQAIPTPATASEAASDLAATAAEVAPSITVSSVTDPSFTATETPTPTIAQPISQNDASTSQPENVIAPDSAIVPNVAVPAQQQVLESIAPWGRIGGVGSLPVVLGYAGHADSKIRRQVAVELGQVIATYGNRVETQRCIPTLARLSQDSNASVRQAAVQSLGNVPSVKVLPYLKRALRDSNLDVVRTASTAIARFKLYGRQEANLTSGSKKSPLTKQKPTYS